MKIEPTKDIIKKYKDCIVHELHFCPTRSILFNFTSNMCIKNSGSKWWDIGELMRKL